MTIDTLALYDDCQLASKNYSNLEVKDFYQYLKKEYNTNLSGLRNSIIEYVSKKYPNFYWISQQNTSWRSNCFEYIGPGLLSLYFRYINELDLKKGLEVFQLFNQYESLYRKNADLFPITISFNINQETIYIKNGLSVLSKDNTSKEEKIPNSEGKSFNVIFRNFPTTNEEIFIKWLLECYDIIASYKFNTIFPRQIPLLIEVIYLYFNYYHYVFSDKDVYSLCFILISQRYGFTDFNFDSPKVADEIALYDIQTNSMFNKFYDISKLSDVSKLFKMLKEIHDIFHQIEEEEGIYSNYIFTDWLKTKNMENGLVELKKAFMERMHYVLLKNPEDEEM